MIDLFATPKAVGLITGLSSAVATQAAQMAQGSSVMTEWTVLVGVGTGTLGWGIAWGTMRTKLAAQDAARKELKADTDKVAARLEANNDRVAAKVDEHTDKLRAEIRDNAKEHQETMNTILREVGSLSTTLDTTVRETRQMIADHTMSCPAATKTRRR